MKNFLIDHQDFRPVAAAYALIVVGLASLSHSMHAGPKFAAAFHAIWTAL